MDKVGRLNLLTLLALPVIVVTLVACGSETAPADDTPNGAKAQVTSDPSVAETAPSDSTPIGGEPAEEAPTATPVAEVQDTSRTSSDEYLAICGRIGLASEDSSEEPFTFKESIAELRDITKQFESMEPPEEFANWHDATVIYLRELQKTVADAPGPGEGASQDELEEYILDIVLPVGIQHYPKIVEIIKDMDRDAIVAMVEAGCIDTAIFTEEEMKELGLGEDGSVIAEFASISAGVEHTCGIGVDGSVACWGDDGVGQSTPPYGKFGYVSTGYCHTCGVRTDGTVVCWGLDSRPSKAPDGEFVSVSAGNGHTCGVKTNGSVACWGYDEYGQSTPPDGVFTSVSAGEDHTCGVWTNGSVACWGLGEDGQSTPPDGVFIFVSAGGYHTCGVKTNGSVACWGWNEYGQSTPPDGVFTSVSAGKASHTCGVRADGTVACWGWNGDGRATPPRARGSGKAPANGTPAGVKPTEETPTVTPVAEVQDTSHRSPDEYLAICGQAEAAMAGEADDDVEELFTLKEFAVRTRAAIKLFESVEPPEEFADWHDAMVVYLKAFEKVVADAPGPGDGASQEEVEEYVSRIMTPVAFQHLPKIVEIVKGMERDAIAGMVEAGCTDEETLGASFAE